MNLSKCKRPVASMATAMLVGVATLWLTSATAFAAEIKTMTFNIKWGAQFDLFDPARSWDYLLDNTNDRRDRVVSVINDFAPHILGTQEMKFQQLSYLEDKLSNYGYYGVGRGTGGEGFNSGERSGIFYDESRFIRTNQGEFWLSDTPTVAGTTFSQQDAGNPRMATWVTLQDTQSGESYFVMNTHWSHIDSAARLKSGELMRDKIDELAAGLPIIVMGDLNEISGRQGYEALLGINDPDEFQLIDGYDQSGEPEGKTFHNWNGGTSGSRIDHILYSEGDFETVDASIVRTTFDGLYSSDHYPVTVTLSTVPLPAGAWLFISALGGLVVAKRRKTSIL